MGNLRQSRLFHEAERIFLLLWFATVTTDLWFFLIYGPREQQPLAWVVTVTIASIIAIAIFFASVGHIGGIHCDSCLRELAVEYDMKNSWNIRFVRHFHIYGAITIKKRLIWIAVILGGSMLFGLSHPIGYVIGTAVFWAIGWNRFVEYRHRRLQAYCPWCRHGGGGGGVDTAPTPPGMEVSR